MRSVLVGLLVLLLVRPATADVQCDGVDDVLSTGLAVSTFVNASAFTLTAWIKSTGSTVASSNCYDGAPVLADTGGYVALGRGVSGATGACGYVWDGGAKQVTAAMSSGWHHIAVRSSGGTLELFVDGVSAQSDSTGGIQDMTGALALCNSNSGTVSPDRLTDVRLYNSALSSAEIETMGKSRRRRPGPTLPTALWPLDQCSDGSSGNGVGFVDRSGNGRTATGNQGGNASGLTCYASEYLTRTWGVQ